MPDTIEFVEPLPGLGSEADEYFDDAIARETGLIEAYRNSDLADEDGHDDFADENDDDDVDAEPQAVFKSTRFPAQELAAPPPRPVPNQTEVEIVPPRVNLAELKKRIQERKRVVVGIDKGGRDETAIHVFDHTSDALPYVTAAPSNRDLHELRLTKADPYGMLAWAARKLGLDTTWPPESEPLGVVAGDELRAVLVYNAFYGDQAQMHIASGHTRRWATRNILGGIFGYAFHFKRLNRLNCEIEETNLPAIITALKCGFKIEGVKRAGGSFTGANAVCFGMLAHECRWTVEDSTQV